MAQQPNPDEQNDRWRLLCARDSESHVRYVVVYPAGGTRWGQPVGLEEFRHAYCRPGLGQPVAPAGLQARARLWLEAGTL